NVHSCGECTNRHPKEGISFYRPPADPERCAKWVSAIKRDRWKPAEGSCLCSQHLVGGKL
ncbi:hypothetical protein NL108_000585, partial [Boleophthalmus pectinirostris]